ncbi:response regulator transcription factor [Nitrosomonas aestuarii]|uniref:response regulator transcription factor n=1 Tax=Nitrosomonas aestuarii TaxID=52441 RepID=UPI000D316AA4|nr:response regulator [Nitrosomonas aestuarii]PTN13162.1 LuxR family two component transcriptional regulator [Nitrosomonas aestuarii]
MSLSEFTVFIIDDDAAVRRSLKLLIEQENIRVQDFENAEVFLKALKPDFTGCIVTDINMPGMDGLQLQEVLHHHQYTMPVIFLTGYGTIPRSVRAIKAGAVDFLTKPITREKLLVSIRAAFIECKKLMETNRHNCEAKSRLSKLTEREKEVMVLVVQGFSSKEIATQLDISHRTVEIHRGNIMHKTGAANLLELAQLAHDTELDDYKYSN